MSDELTVRLRELAETAEAPPPGSGAEVRATAGRRRRRRRTSAAVAGGCAAAGLAAVLTLNVASHGTEQRPSTAMSSVPSVTAAPEVTVDLSRRVLTFEGRDLPISAGTVRTPTPTGLMTVSAKYSVKTISAATVEFPDEYDVKLPWVLELSPATDGTDATDGARRTAEPIDGTEEPDGTDETGGTDGTGTSENTSEKANEEVSEGTTPSPVGSDIWIAALSRNEKAPGTLDTTSGWIGLRTADARWLYARLTTGALVEIRGTAPPPTETPPTTADDSVLPTPLP